MSKREQRKTYTIAAWADVWMEVYAAPRCRESTLEAYRDCRRRMGAMFPEFERMRLGEVRPFEVQRCFNDLAQKYARSTVSHMRSFYHLVYEDAVKNGLCRSNPVRETTVPKTAAVKKVTALSQEEQAAFEAALTALPVKDQFVVQTYLLTGLRRNELVELTWDDWDRERKVLLIRRSKTENGIREVPVIPEVALILTHLWHLRTPGCPYIFSFQGGRLPEGHIRFICQKASRLAGIRHVHPHMLRHTFATRMVEHKVDPKSLAAIIGHADVAFTMQRYVEVDRTHHLREEMMRLSKFSSEKD